MKAQPLRNEFGRYVKCSAADASHVALQFPGPSGRIILPVITRGTRAGTGCWTWNGDTEKPTLRPSIATSMGRDGRIVCHSWVNDGRVQFLDDCTHALRGQTLDLLDVPAAPQPPHDAGGAS